MARRYYMCVSRVFFKDTATTEIYTYLHTLSLHDALPIYCASFPVWVPIPQQRWQRLPLANARWWSMPMSSASSRVCSRSMNRCPQRVQRSAARSEEHTSELQSLMRIPYAVFCLKKKKYTSTHMYVIPTTIYNTDNY